MTSEVAGSDQADVDLVSGFLSGALAAKIGLKPEDLDLGLEIARAHMQRGAFVEALRVYAALVLCRPGDADLQIGLANCTLQLGEYHVALQAASVAVAIAPRDPRGYYLSGRACLGLGLLNEAQEDLQAAIKFGQEARDAVSVEEARRLLQAMPPAELPQERRAAMA